MNNERSYSGNFPDASLFSLEKVDEEFREKFAGKQTVQSAALERQASSQNGSSVKPLDELISDIFNEFETSTEEQFVECLSSETGTVTVVADVSEIIDANENPKPEKRTGISIYLFALVLFFFTVSLLQSFGSSRPTGKYSLLNVLSDSMQSELPKGSLIIVKNIDPYAIEVGDSITYLININETITHKVIEIHENKKNGKLEFITQGTENHNADPPVSSDFVLGKVVWHVPIIGLILTWVKKNLILCALILLIPFLLFKIHMAKTKKKQKTAETIKIEN